MASKASIFASGKCCIDSDGKSMTLKSKTLRQVLKQKGYTQAFAAQELGMSRAEFVRKLYRRQRFTQREIEALVHLIGARSAIEVIWFPSLRDKVATEEYVWGQK